MSLSLHMAHTFLQFNLHAMNFTHLFVRVENDNLVVYSREDGEEVTRALLTQIHRNGYLLSIACPRGGLQPTPYVGTLGDLIPILTGKLAAVLARWP
ncbi:hypothetical protein [Cohnella thermotolerans]|jgi:hypothetical protein|uniref:hypothetical protein n=1 Tax=Cohnella thermotolerans TaxID=329858 RepID=UPI00040376E9|nr:hypothetical protein [Cohnella thermotolerans]